MRWSNFVWRPIWTPQDGWPWVTIESFCPFKKTLASFRGEDLGRVKYDKISRVHEFVSVWAYACVTGAWQRRGLEIQQGATADTETLRPAGFNPFWTGPSTNMGPYVRKRTRAPLCYFKWGRKTKTFCQPLFPLQLDQSSSHPARMGERSQRTGTKTNTRAHSTMSPWGDRKVNYIKWTHAILIPLKLWITPLINHTLIGVLNFYVHPQSQRNNLIPPQHKARLFLSPRWAILHCPRILAQLSLCQTIISGFNLIIITLLSYFN